MVFFEFLSEGMQYKPYKATGGGFHTPASRQSILLSKHYAINDLACLADDDVLHKAGDSDMARSISEWTANEQRPIKNWYVN